MQQCQRRAFPNVRILQLQLVPSGCWNSVPATHTHTHWLWVCHLVQLLCPSFMVCLSNNVFKLFCLDTHLAAVYLLTLISVCQLCQIEQCTDTWREECDVKGRKRPHKGSPQEGVERWRKAGGGVGGGEVWDSFCSAHKQTPYTPYEPKVTASLLLWVSTEVYTDMHELTGGCEASTDSSCLSFTPETCRQTRLGVDMSPPSPPP